MCWSTSRLSAQADGFGAVVLIGSEPPRVQPSRINPANWGDADA
jgi:hypothetical protein